MSVLVEVAIWLLNNNMLVAAFHGATCLQNLSRISIRVETKN